ncbi:hypothetical protein [Nocardioides sp. R-C-SC26]|uniref:hypothetical protein n=1 Tax=Nocardioides sp. R-C-SC26 TaxID=2870414 RepID=UPI001E3C0759|nr:hypothetical protein [Nocardioides sp. R-C-SC26]
MNRPTGPDGSEWEHAMSDTFDRRVRDLRESPLSFDAVTTTARRIRRRRQAAVAGGVIAVAAAITPVALIAVDRDDARSGELPPATTTPEVDRPDSGIDVGVPLIEGDTLTVDGTAYDLPSVSYRAAALLGDRILAYRTVREGPNQGDGVVEVIEDGIVTDAWQKTTPMIVSDSGQTVAFRMADGELMTVWDDDQVGMGSDFPPDAFPVAITGGPNCYEVADGCTVVFTDPGAGVFTADSHGITDTFAGDALAARDAWSSDDGARGLVTVLRQSGTAGAACSGIWDVRANEYAFTTCDYVVESIAPDGRHVIATDLYADGPGPTWFAVLDLKGNEVARYAPESGFVGRTVWEDPANIVASVFDGARWHLIRQPIDSGSLEEITSSDDGDEIDAAYYPQ